VVTDEFGFLKRLGKVELYIGRKSKEENEFIFDELYKKKDNIESVFGEALQWNRFNDKKACGIKCEKAYDSNNKEVWEEMTDYLVASMIRFEKAIKPHLITIRKDLIQTFKLR